MRNSILLLLIMLLSSAAFGALGDNAPSVPSTYVSSHPRLGAPDKAFLDLIWLNRNGGASRYWTAANGWDSAAPGTLIDFRRLLIAYMAERAHQGPHTASYLSKITEMAKPTGSWALENCGGWTSGIGIALAYDWTYADLSDSTRATMRSTLYTIMEQFEANFEGSSPYNDQFYITGCRQVIHLIPALAIYPDDPARSLPHLRWSMDLWLNRLIPAWKQVMSGGNCGASNDSDIHCGGGWHEGWEYVNQAMGLKSWYVPSLLAWANASGDPIFRREPWLKNFAYWMMYQVRPDFVVEPIGAVSRPYFSNEYDGPAAALGSLDGLAAIYDDPTLRGWSRLVNWGDKAPDGFEPSAWPYYAPDNKTKTASTRSALAKTKDFPGWGTIFFRTGWNEDDTFCTLRYGDNFWSHPVQDTGAFTCFNRGPLAIRSGTYRPGSASPHFAQYAIQAIAQNVITITDPGDSYRDETYTFIRPDGSNAAAVMPNDGGQRRVGSALGNMGGLASYQRSPDDPAQWMRNREYFHTGTLLAFAVGADNKYSYAAVDTTPAYNNAFSHGQHTGPWHPREANTSNRSYRVQKAVRHFLFIPRRSAAYVIVYDQIVAASANFSKKWLLHSINKPTISRNAYTITRTELAKSLPFSDLWPSKWASHLRFTSGSADYQYAGILYGWGTLPAAASTDAVGGPGHEFDIGGRNFNECSQGQCTHGEETSYNEGLGSVTGLVGSETNAAPQQVGAWRLEQSPAAAAKEDWFLNVMLVTNRTDSNLVSTPPVTSVDGDNFITTWKDNTDGCTYVVTLPKYGVGGSVKVSGAGCASTF